MACIRVDTLQKRFTNIIYAVNNSRTDDYITSRTQNPAWVLLASRRAPLVIACLQTLFEDAHDGVLIDDALHALAAMLAPRCTYAATMAT